MFIIIYFFGYKHKQQIKKINYIDVFLFIIFGNKLKNINDIQDGERKQHSQQARMEQGNHVR